MSLKQKLLAPVLLLASIVGGSAMAQEKPALPDTPSANLKLPNLFQQHFSYAATHPAFDYKVLPPKTDPDLPLGDGFIGRIAGYVDRHSNFSQPPFDFAMGYKLQNHFTLMAGTTVDMRTHSGQYEANRQAVRVMTGMPDWETRNLRDMMSGGVVSRGGLRGGGDGFAVGIKIDLGGKR